jgi:hypothetical protein
MVHMKTFGFILIFSMMLSFSGIATADELTVLQPKGGTYKQLTSMLIKWDYTILSNLTTPYEKEMEIWLAKPTSTVAAPYLIDRIAQVDVFAGSTNWTVKAPPGAYRLQFYKRYAPMEGSWAVSDPFTVEKNELLATMRPKAAAMALPIPITNPLQGQVYTTGTSMTIQWDKSIIANYPTVWLQTCWSDGKPAAGAYPTPNTGSYVWTIKETAENSLRVSVFTPDDKHKGLSGVFQIKLPKKLPAKVQKSILN